jgi:hypothetical protein
MKSKGRMMSTDTKSLGVVPTREAFAAEIVETVSVHQMNWGMQRQLKRQLRGIDRTEQVTVAALQAGSRLMANAAMNLSYALHVSVIAANAASLQGEEEIVRVMHLREKFIDDMTDIVEIASHKLKRAVAAIPDATSDFKLRDELGL